MCWREWTRKCGIHSKRAYFYMKYGFFIVSAHYLLLESETKIYNKWLNRGVLLRTLKSIQCHPIRTGIKNSFTWRLLYSVLVQSLQGFLSDHCHRSNQTAEPVHFSLDLIQNSLVFHVSPEAKAQGWENSFTRYRSAEIFPNCTPQIFMNRKKIKDLVRVRFFKCLPFSAHLCVLLSSNQTLIINFGNEL